MRRLACAAIVLGFTCFGRPAPATAQEARPTADATERARQLFAEALALADAGDWERAVHRFRSAIELRDAPTIRYNLASSLAHLDRLLPALAELDHVDASAESTPELRAQAAALRATITPRLGRLRVEIRGDPVGTHVTVDGAPWEHIGVVAPSNPGIVVVRLWRGENELDREEVDVPDGGEASAVVVVPPPLVESAEGGAAPEVLEAPSASGDDGLAIGLGVAIGVVVAAAAAILTGVLVAGSAPQPSAGDFSPAVLRID